MAKQTQTGTGLTRLFCCVLVLAVQFLALSSVSAGALEDHLGRYHDGYGSKTADDEQLKMARLAVIGYGAKQGLKSMGVDYQQAKTLLKRLTVHSITPSSSVMIEPERINFMTKHHEGAFITELSGKADGEIGLSLKVPF
ncbi:MAG: hypothetical protein V7707_02185 [Motiliproteus sp.]